MVNLKSAISRRLGTMAKKDREKLRKAAARKAKAVAKAKEDAKAKSADAPTRAHGFDNPIGGRKSFGQDSAGSPLMPRRSKKG